MKFITITPVFEDENPTLTGKGPTLTDCILDLLNQIKEMAGKNPFDDLAMTKFFEGFTAILEADEQAESDFVFQHRDFSCPEDQFDISYGETPDMPTERVYPDFLSWDHSDEYEAANGPIDWNLYAQERNISPAPTSQEAISELFKSTVPA